MGRVGRTLLIQLLTSATVSNPHSRTHQILWVYMENIGPGPREECSLTCNGVGRHDSDLAKPERYIGQE